MRAEALPNTMQRETQHWFLQAARNTQLWAYALKLCNHNRHPHGTCHANMPQSDNMLLFYVFIICFCATSKRGRLLGLRTQAWLRVGCSAAGLTLIAALRRVLCTYGCPDGLTRFGCPSAGSSQLAAPKGLTRFGCPTGLTRIAALRRVLRTSGCPIGSAHLAALRRVLRIPGCPSGLTRIAALLRVLRSSGCPRGSYTLWLPCGGSYAFLAALRRVLRITGCPTGLTHFGCPLGLTH